MAPHVKATHESGCDGSLYRLNHPILTDRIGRIGNGGRINHDYRCNRHWAGCPARVLVPESQLHDIATASLLVPKGEVMNPVFSHMTELDGLHRQVVLLERRDRRLSARVVELEAFILSVHGDAPSVAVYDALLTSKEK